MPRRIRPQRNLALLERLTDAGVEFCIIGGIAAVLHGATRMTVDLDIAAPFTKDNLMRLLSALADLDVRHATRPDLRVADEPIDRLLTFRLLLLETDMGRLDVLREVTPLGTYSVLNMVEIDVGQRRCKVLAIDDLITVKRSLTRPQDAEVVVQLEAVRERLRAGDDD
jgi:predicted nucleotidyltransferase